MDFNKAKELIIELLRKNRKARNSEMIDLLDGDRELFERVREELIFDDIAKDKDNVGLIYIAPDQDKAEEAKPEESTDEEFLTRFIFISYGRDDASDLAEKLKKELEEKGHEVWMDICKIRDGKDWEYEIEQAIEKCDVFLSLLSPHAVRRPDGVCLDEISFARYNGKRIIPVMVIPCKPPLCIYRLDWIDFRELKIDDQKALNRLIKEITSNEQYVEGTYAEIFSKLKPIDFGTRISNLTRDFTGREWLIDELNEWLNNEESRVFFVTGDPGVGKSAVMAHLIEKNELVNAYHFCLFHLAESTEPGIFIKSISAQLATQIKDYYEALKGIGDLDLDDVVKQDANSLFKRLITDPLSKIKQPDSTILIVIDAFDESLGVKEINISSLLRNCLNDLPKWVRLVISSRKEAKIIDTFSEFKPHEIDAGREENIKDINDYVTKKLKEPKIAKLLEENNANPDRIKDAIIQNSENNFLYVTEVIKGIINKSIDLQHPENFPPGLVGLYQDFFNRLFPGGKGYDEIRPLLEIITASREPLTREEIAFFMSCDEFNLRNQLAKINTFFPDRNRRYYPYHKSLIDWLSGDVGKDPTFNINIKRGNNVICNQLLSDRLPDSLRKYKLSHLPAHLASALRFDELKSILTNFKFIEGRLNQVGIVELIKDYDLLSTDVDLRRIQGALRLSANALRRDPNELISQLYGRLMSDNSPVIKGLLNNAMKEIRKPWLKMLQQSLIPPGGSLLYTLEGHTDTVTSVALSEDGKRAVSASGDETLKIWDMETGEEIRTLKGHTAWVTSVALSVDGKRAVSASNDSTLKIWDMETGEEIRTLEGHTLDVTSVALSVDGKRAVSASQDNTLKIWDMKTGREIRTLKGHTAWVNSVALSEDGKRAVSASQDNTLKIWDMETGEEIRTLQRHTDRVNSVVLSNDGKRAVSASGDKTLKIWDMETGEEIRTLKGHTDQVTSVALSEDGKRAVSASWDRTLKIWDMEAGEEIRTLEGHTSEVTSVALSNDGKRAVSASYDSTLKIWDMETGEEIRILEGHTSTVTSVALSVDGKRAVSTSDDNTLKIWDMETGEEIRTLEGHTGKVTSVALSEDGKRAVSASNDSTLKIWDMETGEEIRTLEGHTDRVNSVVLSNDGKRAVSASWDRTLKIWDMEIGEVIAGIGGDSEIDCCAIAPDGQTIVTGDGTGRVHFLRLENYGKVISNQ